MLLIHKNNHTLHYSLEVMIASSLYDCSNFLTQTKAVEMKEVSLYNNGGGGYGPSNDGEKSLSFRVVPTSWEQKAQRGIPRPYPHNKFPAHHPMKLLVTEASFIF